MVVGSLGSAGEAASGASVRSELTARVAVVVLPECPYPPAFGNALRDAQQVALLQRAGHRVVVLALRPRAGSSAAEDRALASAQGVTLALASEHDLSLPEGLAATLRRKLGYLTADNAAHPFAWWAAPYELGNGLAALVQRERPRVVLLRSLFADLAAVVRVGGAAVVLDCHDADPHLAREAVRSVAWWRRLGPLANQRGVASFCARFFPAADELWAVSEDDAGRLRRFAGGRPVRVVPSGVDERAIVAAPVAGEDDLCAMVANFGYGPNLQAAIWLLEAVWPRVRGARPAARLWLVGRGLPESVRRRAGRAAGVEVLGFVEDLAPIHARAGVMLAPLLTGGGTRLKIVDAWRHGKAVLTTAKGIEGLPVAGAQIAAGGAAFAAALAGLLGERERRGAVAASGMAAARAGLTWEQILARLAAQESCALGGGASRTGSVGVRR